MSIDERTLAVIEAFYDAAMEKALWPEALRLLTDLTASQAATFWVLDSAPEPRLPTLITLNFDPRFMEAYQAGMVPLDPTVRYLVAHPDEPIVHDGLVISERQKDRHAYYDWHGRWSDTRFRMVGQARPAPTMQAGVALHRSRKAGRYEPGDIEQFAFLHRHLEQSLRIGCRLGTLGAMQQCSVELLDRNPAAILLLDERKRVVFANCSAQSLDGDGIRLSPTGVTLSRKQDNDRLGSLIDQTLSPNGVAAGYAMRAPRPSGKRPYGILVGPVSRKYSMLSVLQPAVCIVVTDPEHAAPLLKQRLQTAFGLTDAEARLAALLAEGEKLHAAAGKLRITYGTGRTRLAEIFQKTETRSQGELVAVMLRTLAPA